MAEVILNIDRAVHSLSAVKKAAYRFADRFFVHLELPSEAVIQVRLKAKSEGMLFDTLEGEFRNELLDQDLRESIAEQTERVRNLLLAQAFSGFSVTDEVADTADYRDDPLGIRRSQVENP